MSIEEQQKMMETVSEMCKAAKMDYIFITDDTSSWSVRGKKPLTVLKDVIKAAMKR